MTDEQTFKDLAYLLGLYPDVNSTTAARTTDNHVWIKFRWGSFASLKAISDGAAASNLGLQVGASHTQYSSETGTSNDLSFTLSIDDDWGQSVPPSKSQIFGIFLVRDLKTAGRLDPSKFNTMQRRWNACSQ